MQRPVIYAYDEGYELQRINKTWFNVRVLKHYQLCRIRKEIELHRKIHDLEAEFDVHLADFDAKRRAIISGDYVPTKEECKYEFGDQALPEPTAPKQNGIPYFWHRIFDNLHLTSQLIEPEDRPAIMHLVDVRYVILKDLQGFKLEFEFSENEFFTNKVLTKEYYYSNKECPDNPLRHEGIILTRAVGCKIDWKPEKDLTHKKVTKKVLYKSGTRRKVKALEVLVPRSFFSFFSPPTGDLHSYHKSFQKIMKEDFAIGETMRDLVIPRAIVYYTGEGIEDDEQSEQNTAKVDREQTDKMDWEDYNQTDQDDEDYDEDMDE